MSYPISRCRFPEDVQKLIRIAAQHGLVVSALEAEKAWEEASDDACAQWLIVNTYDDKEVWEKLPYWFKGEKERSDWDE